MNDENFEKVLDKIARTSGSDKEEVRRKIEAKRAKLSDLISYEGAAQIVAAELGVDFENEQLKIDELLPGMRKVNVVGKIINLFPVRSYKNKKGEDSKVANLVIADESSNIKAVLWDTNHIELIEKGEVIEGSVVEISNASMRDNELHLGSFSEFKKSGESLTDVVTEKIIKEKNISDFAISEDVKTRAFIVQSFQPKFFHTCPECRKKVATDGENFVCLEHGKVVPEKKALINIVLDDGTETIRSVLFHDNLPLLGLTELDDIQKITSQRENLLGKEMSFSGQVRMNKYFNEPEFVINSVQTINLDELLAKLEKK